MANLTTDFIKVAQVGPSVDGRFIREEWIRDMAETYSPGTYTSMLWPEHVRWCGNFGEVVELQAGPDDKGVYSLFARFKPNALLLEYNASGQGLFYSIEVEENFADSGKAYLVGLGVTDSPASLGLQSTRFTAKKDTVFIGNVPFTPLAIFSDQDLGRRSPRDSALSDKAGSGALLGNMVPAAGAEEVAPGWFKRFFPSLFTSDSGDAPPEQKDTPMEELESRVAALEDGQAAITEQLASIDGRLAALEVDVAAGGSGEGASDDPAYKALARQFGALRRDLGAFTKQISAAAKPGTPAPRTTGAAGGKKLY